MKIYGVAFLALCFLLGQVIGQLLGKAIGIDGNVGGVGFGMLLLVIINDRLGKKYPMLQESKAGIYFWGSMYIPVVIAMSMILNVRAALSGGWVAVIVGIVATGACYFLVPVLTKWSKSGEKIS
ncbi:malonate transporter subunit MadL [Algoriphagus sediminis]|uniref:Malonate transporter subunit MadL n=1 Tax=Algoriphagus sediminis TaxID=3057113 RepID=A0ABT7YD33_9BACT|nr:malonate transporter subunit MadL [Algoriphagus sediminis]MDN3204438.1 malonate transporter subunit MadL [Algoriphagus sediminis]